MYRIIDAFNSLFKRKLLSILIITQLFLSISCLTMTINTFKNLLYLNKSNNCLLDFNTPIYTLNTDKSNTLKTPTDDLIAESKAVYNELSNDANLSGFGSYTIEAMPFENSSKKIDTAFLSNFKKPFANVGTTMIDTLNIDYGFYSISNIEVSSGRVFSKEDFSSTNDKKIDIILGDSFKNYLSLGDVINNKYRIIGFLKEGIFSLQNNAASDYLNLDKCIIIPCTFSDDLQRYFNLYQSTIFKLKDSSKLKPVNEAIALKGKTLSLKASSLKSMFQKNYDTILTQEKPNLTIEACFLFFSIIGIVIVTVVSILLRKRDIGIRLAVGDSIYGIWFQTFLENLILGISALILSIIYFFTRFNNYMNFLKYVSSISADNMQMNPQIVTALFILILFILFAANSIVFLFLKKLQPKEMIGGVD